MKPFVDKIDKFLDQLTEQAILSAANDFDNSIGEIRSTSTNSDILSTATSCQSMLNAIQNSPSNSSTASLVVNVLKGFNSLENYVGSQFVEVTMARSLVMFSAWSLFSWPDLIVRTSMSQKAHNLECWVDQLVSDVYQALRNVGPGQPEVTFSSADYLATIDPPNKYLYRCARYRASWSMERVAEEAYLLATAIIRQWIGLPNDGIFLARYAFLNAFLSMKHETNAILYLSVVWDIYQNPSLRLLRGTAKSEKKNPQEQFSGFRKRLQQHPISNPNSKRCEYLIHLRTRSDAWYKTRTSDNPEVSIMFLLFFASKSVLLKISRLPAVTLPSLNRSASVPNLQAASQPVR